MSQKETGYVGWVGSRQFKGNTLWSFRLKNVERWYGCGRIEPKIHKGDHVEFNYDEKDGQYVVDVDSINRINGGGVVTGRSSRAGAFTGSAFGKESGSSGDGKSGYWDERLARDVANDEYRKANDIKIQYQSARNAAIEWVANLLTAGVVKIPEKNGKTVMDGLLADYTNQFFDATSNVGEVIKAEETEIPYEAVA